MARKALFIIGLVVIAGIFYSLSKQIYDSLKVSRRWDMETEELVRLQKRNEELKKKLTEVQSIGFIEQQARDKLNLARPNETVAVIPKEELDKVLGVMEEKKVELEPYWQGWLKLFWK